MSSRAKHVLISFAIALGILLVFAVVGFWWVLRPNMRVYVKGCMRADASLREPLLDYDYVIIGKWDSPYKGDPRLEIRYEDGQILPFPNPDLELARALSHKERSTSKYTRAGFPDAQEIFLPASSIVISGDRVLEIELNTLWSEDHIQVRTPRTDEWRSMPLSEQDLFDLFGQPDHLFDQLRH